MPLASPAHRAANGFFYGGLLAVLAIVALPLLIGAIGSVPALASWVTVARVLRVPLGFAAGAAAAAPSLEKGGRGLGGALVGAQVAGALLVWPVSLAQGLTGFEPMLPLLTVPCVSFAVAFGVNGLIVASAVAGRAEAWPTARWAAAGGVVGGLLLVLPALVARTSLRAALGGAWGLVEATCSAGSIVVPFTGVGWAAGRALERSGDRTTAGSRPDCPPSFPR